MLQQRATVSNREVFGFPRVVHVVKETCVVEVERGPDICLERHVLVEEAVPEDMEADPGDVEAQHQQRELLAF